ncbi:MAG: restriction endonuclease [Caldilineae bacterium]|nr:MAG: restriction endonuclease [Caldilineae bacterium]
MSIDDLRQKYHRRICERILYLKTGNIPNFADKHSRPSVALAQKIVEQFQQRGYPLQTKQPTGQTAGTTFEEVTRDFLEEAFKLLRHLRPGEWKFHVNDKIERYEQYEHLAILGKTLKEHKELRAALGDYIIKPDIVISREPVSDDEINQPGEIVSGKAGISQLTPLRASNAENPKPILHASISCKWTIRSDRSQNAPTERLNLIRNRKGHTPHIAIVTAEPYPQRIASLALGTGDIDCVYHIALPELQNAAEAYNNEAVLDMLDTLIRGKRLRDISDLPFDLAT